ncbi:putative membrane-anchored protein [Novosphingobium capsulatum]|uniref:Membrane-anchored protein n=1 Tax=Novosphingobium capsulatum TaxID=13688 RepID=A0ABU1MNM4_9SPHN|nr:hypothetical protein [Novosphingobium capsulatum]MDR6511931.1 putative membrane-anchored protein [Novosphingobium capsulatum]
MASPYPPPSFSEALSKVPAVTLGFWIIKIFATTLGETAGDAVTMTWLGETTPHPVFPNHWGYVIATVAFAAVLVGLIMAQIKASRFHPMLYWATIIASTTAGTALADFSTRFLGEGTVASYLLGTVILLACVLGSLAVWRKVLGTVSVGSVHEPKAELFYWVTITFSQTLGTALGDWLADTDVGGTPLGFVNAAVVFAAGLAVVALLYYRTKVSRTGLFWAAFILTRPLGAAVGDFLDKPIAKGGLAISRPLASIVLLILIAAGMLVFPQRSAKAGAGH